MGVCYRILDHGTKRILDVSKGPWSVILHETGKYVRLCPPDCKAALAGTYWVWAVPVTEWRESYLTPTRDIPKDVRSFYERMVAEDSWWNDECCLLEDDDGAWRITIAERVVKWRGDSPGPFTLANDSESSDAYFDFARSFGYVVWNLYPLDKEMAVDDDD